MRHYEMFLQAWLVEVALIAPLKDAFVLIVSLGTMGLLVLFQVGTWSELLIAVLALVGLLSCVDALVSNQILDLWECLIATLDITFEGFEFIVDASMFLKWREFCETLITDIAVENVVLIRQKLNWLPFKIKIKYLREYK